MFDSMELEKTASGRYGLWEEGGYQNLGGSATIIAKRDGSKPRAALVQTGGHLAGGRHALVCVHVEYYVIHAHIDVMGRTRVLIRRIVAVPTRQDRHCGRPPVATLELVNSAICNEWRTPLDSSLVNAVKAAVYKTSIRDCCAPVYVNTHKPRSLRADRRKLLRQAAEPSRNVESVRLRAEEAVVVADAASKEEVATRKAAEAAELRARLDAAIARFNQLRTQDPNTSYCCLEHGEDDSYFIFDGDDMRYTDDNLTAVEGCISNYEEFYRQKLRRYADRARFRRQFVALLPRVKALGRTMCFGATSVSWGGFRDYGSYSYSQLGIDMFTEGLTREETKRAVAESEVWPATNPVDLDREIPALVQLTEANDNS